MTHQEATRAFYRLMWPLAESVLRTARFLTADVGEADDLAQETMLKAFKAIAGFRQGTDAKAWLMTILRHTWIDRLRQRRAAPHLVSLEQLDFEPVQRPDVTGPSDVIAAGNELLDQFSDQEVIDALRCLPEDIRWTMLLVDVEQLDQSEAAAILDVPLGTIKSRTHRGRAMLRESLMELANDLRLTRRTG